MLVNIVYLLFLILLPTARGNLQATYPVHEDSLPDVADTVIHETARINELVLINTFGHVLRKGVNCDLHLLGKVRHNWKKTGA